MFLNFKDDIAGHNVSTGLKLNIDFSPEDLCYKAATELQDYLSVNEILNHNFGLSKDDQSTIIGKMFGVLVVQTSDDQIGYLAAFSGKLGGKNNHPNFVPPVFDLLTKGSFLNEGMEQLSTMNEQIQQTDIDNGDLQGLKAARRKHSKMLQQKIFEQYYFSNQSKTYKSLNAIFLDAGYRNPPAGAGECAGIKLLQYAYLNDMRPLELAEFWWGQSPKSATWEHGRFYPSCKEKCEPILKHMLST
jgi:tRNA pseudouridine32 synthase/23S rRNA pseudouridine746 synthase